MSRKMPRGAKPTPRGILAAAAAYQPAGSGNNSVPSGIFPSPNHELAAAERYRGGQAPESFLAWPTAIDAWEDQGTGQWAEEAFAKACADPGVLIPNRVVQSASRKCGGANFAAFMRTHGFQMDGKAYLDGGFELVRWTDASTLNCAIANLGPVKIGVASADLASASSGQITPGTNGWTVYGLPANPNEDHCASLCGFGPLAALVDLFKRRGIAVESPPGMPRGLCYAMFMRGSLGIIDRESLMNVTGEAWVRNPTTIVRDLV